MILSDHLSAKFWRLPLVSLHILTAIFLSVTLSLLFSHDTSAANMSQPSDSESRIQDLILTRSVGKCIKGAPYDVGIGDRIGLGDARDGKWFHLFPTLSEYARTGPYMRSISTTFDGADNFNTLCHRDDSLIVRTWLKVRGVGAVDALCKSDFKRESGGETEKDCPNGNGYYTPKDNKHTSSAAFHKAFPEKNLSDKDWYWFYRKTFSYSCGSGKMSNPVDKAYYDSNKSDDGYGYRLVYITDSKANKDAGVPYTKYVYIAGAKERKKSIPTRLGPAPNYDDVNKSCAEIETHIYNLGKKVAGQQTETTIENDKDSSSEAEDNATEEAAPSCVVDGVGWLVCPIVEFMGSITDNAYKAVETLLVTQPLLTTGQNRGAYEAWRIMQGFANASFVIVFIIIIFSQLTSAGVSNYGVKRMLPRLIIGAILVNVSFFICAVAVDLSNIVGSSIKPMLDSIAIPPPSTSVFTELSFEDNTIWGPIIGVVLAGSVAGVAVGTAGFWGALALLVPGLIAAIVAILTVLVVLVIRQALIILLVVISPLAFVAFLLPNTEGLFTKWRKLLVTLLIMYPIIAAIFGLAGLASVIVINSADNALTQIAGALISIIPLAITPIVMKSAGGLLSRVGLFVNNKEKGLFDRANKGAAGFRKNQATRKSIQAFNGGKRGPVKSFRRWNARRGMISSSRQNELSTVQNEYLANALTETNKDRELTRAADSLQKRAAGGTLLSAASDPARQRVASSAISVVQKAKEEEIKNVKMSAKFAPGAVDEIAKAFKEAVKAGDTVRAKAYQDMLQSSGAAGLNAWRNSVGQMEADSGSNIGAMSSDLRKRTMETNPGIKSSDAAAARWATSDKKIDEIRSSKDTWSGLSNEELMSQKGGIDAQTGQISGAIGDALSQGAISSQRAREMTTSESFNKMSEDIKAEIRTLAGN